MTNLESNGRDALDASGDVESGPPPGSGGVGLLVWLSELARGPSDDGHLVDGDGCCAARVIGPFRLEALIGQGAYGAVFRAFDTELERSVALKIAWPHVMFDKVSARRFVEEPKTGAALDHPGIVRIYRSGWVDAVCYIAFELIDGPTLRDWLKSQEHVPFNLAAEIIATVADAVQYAHERGVIHRDVKPGNILLNPRPGNDHFPYRPMVGDFGLAARARPAALSALTGTHDVIGTDPYVAPEQLDGNKGKTEPASDVFSLGVMLYEVVAGRRPFDGENAEDTRRLIRDEEPPSVRSFRPSVPLDLWTIISKCLQKSPAARYESAGELAADLKRFINHEPILARRVAFWQRAWKYARRKPLVVSFASLAAVSVIVVASLLGALVANRISASRRIEVAEATADVAQRMERQRQYAANIRHAAESLHRAGSHEATALLEECRTLADDPAHCGIEWDFLRSQIGNADHVIESHRGRIYVLRFSPDGEFVVSAGQDTHVNLWDTSTWTKCQQFDDGIEDTNAAEFSADGTLLAVAGDDGRVLIHRLPDGAIMYGEPIAKGRIFDIAWLGDCHELAVGGEDATLRVIDADQGRLRAWASLADKRPYPSARPKEEIDVLDYVPGSDAIAVTTSYQFDHLVDAKSLKPVRSWSDVTHGSMCHVGQRPGYLVTGGNRSVSVWNIEAAHRDAVVALHAHPRAIRYSPATQTVAAVLNDGTAATWTFASLLAGEKPVKWYFSNGDGAFCGDISPDGNCFALGDTQGRIHVWQGKQVDSLFDMELSRRAWTARFSPNGRWLAVVEALADDGAARLTVFDVESGRAAWSADAHAAPPTYYENVFKRAPWPIDFDASSSEVYFSPPDRSVCGHNVQTGERTKVYLPPTDSEIAINRIQAMLTTRQLYLARLNNTRSATEAFIVDCSSGRIEHLPLDERLSTFGVVRTVRGDLWLTSENKSRVKYLWASDVTKPVVTLDGCPDTDQYRVAVSPDGRLLAIGGEGRIIYCWDLVAGGPPKKFIGHEGMIADLCFSPDGRTILSHAADGTVRFWHVTTGAELLKLGTPEEPITCMGLNPAGNLLVLGVEREGRYGLQLHRLGKDRNSLPKSFAGLPAKQMSNP